MGDRDANNWVVQLLGGFSVTGENRVLGKLRSSKTEQLFILLLVRLGRGISKESAAQLLWPDTEAPKQGQNLRQCVSSIRAALSDPGLLNSEGDRLSLDESRFKSDYQAFGDLMRRARLADGERKRDLLREAVSLTRGRLLPGVSADWLAPFQSEFDEHLAGALVQLARDHLEAGRPQRAIELCQQGLELLPMSEALYVVLIRACGALGLSAEGIRHYERLVQILEDEWGESPGPAAVAALEALPRAAVMVHASEAGDSAPVARGFYGREQELEALESWFTDPQSKLITVVGIGGSGKTRLAHEFVDRCAPHESCAIVSLIDAVSESDVNFAVANALGVRLAPHADFENEVQPTLQALELMFFDNAEHLKHDLNKVLKVLQRLSPSLKLLVTSRVPLDIPGESLIQLGSLLGQDAGDIDACVALFFDSCRRSGASIRNEEEATVLATSICRALDGYALGIALAGSQAAYRSLPEILSRLQFGDSNFYRGNQEGPDRHASLFAALDGSLALLAQSEAEVLGFLAELSSNFGPLILEHAKLCADGVPLIAKLEKLSLITRYQIGDQTRFRMPVPIRSYCRDQRAIDERAELRRRAVHAALSIASLIEDQFEGEDPGPSIAILLAEQELLLGAVQLSMHDAASQEVGAQILWRLRSVAISAGVSHRWVHHALDHPCRNSPHFKADVRAKSEVVAVILLSNVQESHAAKAIIERAREQLWPDLDQELKARIANAIAFNLLTIPALQVSQIDIEEAIMLLRSCRIALENDDAIWDKRAARLKVAMEANEASLLRLLGKHKEAIELLSAILERSPIDRFYRAYPSLWLALADNLMDCEQRPEAKTAAHKALQSAVSANQPSTVAMARYTLAGFALDDRNIEEVSSWLTECLNENLDTSLRNCACPMVLLSASLSIIGHHEVAREAYQLAGRAGLREGDYRRFSRWASELLPDEPIALMDPALTVEEVRSWWRQALVVLDDYVRESSHADHGERGESDELPVG